MSLLGEKVYRLQPDDCLLTVASDGFRVLGIPPETIYFSLWPLFFPDSRCLVDTTFPIDALRELAKAVPFPFPRRGGPLSDDGSYFAVVPPPYSQRTLYEIRKVLLPLFQAVQAQMLPFLEMWKVIPPKIDQIKGVISGLKERFSTFCASFDHSPDNQEIAEVLANFFELVLERNAQKPELDSPEVLRQKEEERKRQLREKINF